MRDLGIICQGGMYNATIRALQTLGLADTFGASKVPIYCMNVTYPTIPEEIVEFSRSKKSILIVEEGQPAFIEEQVLATLRRHEVNERQGARQGRAADGRRVHRRSGADGHCALHEQGKLP
jgi:indolepyruvate ferredoxin oxidoreductase alpha subunit